MQLLEEKIRREGRVLGTEVLKVDNFLNHQVDPELMAAMGREFAQLFADKGITKVMTVESSGIAPAVFTALELQVPMVFARKKKSLTLTDDNYTADVYSFTKQETNHIIVDKRFISSNDKVLLIDDFLANGQAVQGMMEILDAADADLVGVGIVIEKTFQKGRELLDEKGIHVESLARISAFEDGQVVFAD
ncbi:xanthine phosphoribosyltransferase [Weissella tructae]|jgi:xanthine phosphoribosyltransferase|uniref:Xanthine phosphoribosyltransferase n=2 Tax=Weissella TaxID=46255 RepID=A0A075TTX1_9LACO|nr:MULTISPECIES: xanthine phosphoribosyltransferase [Weissella]AIG64959.1 Xanthine phosphoribosyltransferase [Weissella tructae]AIM62271.1 Xanthine phosphoribosyltransferase [Weissella ceti]AIM63610.1 Xanthine phosphoribosyltransferase [Weissella ceti]ELA07847.1 xanthine phosphoribosyltransferase [Weissella ceti NC36]QVV91371.1 xanthine phosphoribosyltransferase [Weissella tructae]